MSDRNCVLLPLSRIRPTEKTCPVRVDEVLAMITEERAWTRPICVEATVGALLDGHHRFAAARLLGLSRVPVHVFDYEDVRLVSWRPDVVPTREEVLARALRGDLYPCKTTRHIFSARVMRPIPMSELIDTTLEKPEGTETALGSGVLFHETDIAEQIPQVWRLD